MSESTRRASPGQLWGVRGLLAVLALISALFTAQALIQARSVMQLPPINGVPQHRVHVEPGQYVWAGTTLICCLSFTVGLVLSLKGRLRRESWKPLAGVAVVLIPAAVAILGFQGGVF